MNRGTFRNIGFFLCLFPALLLGNQLWLPSPAEGARLRSIPVEITQPDGQVLNVYASGDEFLNWLHDIDGFIIIQDPKSGDYVYAVDADGGIAPSSFPVGMVPPQDIDAKKDFPYSQEKLQDPVFRSLMAYPEPSADSSSEIHAAPRTGTLNNLVIFIRFADDPAFTANISTYDSMFNTSTAGANSMRNYFSEVSYNQLVTTSTFYPTTSGTVLSYQDTAHNRGYYQPYSVTNTIGYTGGDTGSEREFREHTLLKNAIEAVSAQIVASGINIDGDGDGYVDNICFIIKGTVTGWASLLWPHKWQIHSFDVRINGKRAYVYNFQLETALASSGVGVLCHEMFHTLGAPDLYHYSSSSSYSPVWQWDIMEYDLNPPQHMSAYMKKRYGSWIATIPTITASGTYTLNPLTSSTNNAYRINSPNSTTEYFVVEYRRKTGGFESSLPGEGLLVYRVNSIQDGVGNRTGPPDELYVFRPGGTTTAEGTPLNATFNSTSGRTAINDTTNPSSFLSSGGAGGLNISNVTAVGSTISFDVSLGGGLICSPPSSITVPSSDNDGSYTVNWGASSTSGVSYSLEEATNSSFTTGNRVLSVADTSISITGRASGTTYYYRVKATRSGYTDSTWQTGSNGCVVTISTACTALSSGVGAGVSVGLQEQKCFSINVASGATELSTVLNNLTSDLDLYAKYGEPPTTLVYDCSSWLGGTTPETCTQANPTAGTWYFMVYGYTAGNGTITATVTNSTPDYTLTVNSSGASSVAITGNPSTYSGTTNYTRSNIASGISLTLTAPATSGTANFSSWSGCNSISGNTCTVSMTSSKTVTANYTPTYNLTVNSSGASGVNISGSSSTYSGTTNYTRTGITSGTSITLTAPLTSGSTTFSTWSGCDSTSTANKTCTVAMTANRTVSANYATPSIHTVTASANSGGSVSPGTQTVGHGSTTSFTVTPDSGYIHGAVGGSCPVGSFAGNTYTTGPITADCTVSATFAIYTYQLIVNVSGKGLVTSDPGGISCHDDCSEIYDIGTVVTLTAIPHVEATFIGWSGDCVGTDLTCDVTFDQERNVSAKFTSSFPWTMFLPVFIDTKHP